MSDANFEVNYLVTHSGYMHADEVCAAAILQEIFPDADIHRTRVPEAIEALGAEGIVFDVGGVYDPEARRFDHHMRDAAQRPDGVIYSSFGLIWKHFGREYLERRGVHEDMIDPLFERFDAQVVRPIDMIDNGHLSPSTFGDGQAITLPAIVDSFNVGFGETGVRAEQRLMVKACCLVGSILNRKVASLEAALRAEEVITHHVKSQWGNEILELPHSLDFQPILDALEADHVIYVVQPSSSGGFGLSCARTSAGSYENLRDLPEHWAGLTGEDLVSASGVEGATFCHTAKFFAAATSKEAALELAKKALEHEPELQSRGPE